MDDDASVFEDLCVRFDALVDEKFKGIQNLIIESCCDKIISCLLVVETESCNASQDLLEVSGDRSVLNLTTTQMILYACECLSRFSEFIC